MTTVNLPDFDDMQGLIDKITGLSARTALLETEIKMEEANITKIASTNEKYFQNGKPPSQTYIDNAWKYTGFNNELVEKRNILANLNADLEGYRLTLRLYYTMIDVWRTESSNERVALM